MERSEDWMSEARGDLKHGKNDLGGGYYNWACSSAQQAAEKALKAVFQMLGAETWGHSVIDLLGEPDKKYEVSEELQDAALKKELNICDLEPHIYREDEYEEAKEIVEKMEKGGVLLWEKNQK